MMAGVNMLHIPYRGAAPALTDLLAGRVHVMFDNMPSSIEYIRAAKLRPLAVTAMSRLEGLPDIPPIGEFLPGFETSAWAGIGAPKNTPGEIIDKLNLAINATLADPRIHAGNCIHAELTHAPRRGWVCSMHENSCAGSTTT
jgi:tripartite-type tricarboxylate transporter receptor subunit TctC